MGKLKKELSPWRPLTDLMRFKEFFDGMGMAFSHHTDDGEDELFNEVEDSASYLSVPGVFFIFNKDGKFIGTFAEDTEIFLPRKGRA